MPNAVPDKIIDSHEDRISVLEGVSRATATTLGVHSQRLDELASKIDTGFLSMGNKVEEVVHPITQAIERIDTTLNQSNTRLKTLEDNKAERERLEEARKARKARIKALIYTGIGALITFTIKDGIPAILKLMHH